MARSSRKAATRRSPAKEPADLSIRNPRFQKLLLALHSATDSKTFLKAAEQIIHAAIPCDVVYTLLHYSLDRGNSSVAWGSEGTVFTNEHVRGSLVGNPITWVLTNKSGVRAHALQTCYSSAAQMEDDPFFKKYIRGIGIQHAVVMPLWRESLDGADMVIGPHRALGRGEFTRDEMEIMELLHPHIDAAYRRVNRLETRTGELLGLEQCVEALPLPTALLDWELVPFFSNPSGQEAMARWCGASRHLKLPSRGLEMPGDLRRELRTMREQWTISLRDGQGTATLPEHVVEHPTDSGFRARISMTTLRSPHFGKPSFVVRFENDHPGCSNRHAAITLLSPSERRLLERVLAGETNQEIANTLGRSVNTVKSALYEIFNKLGVHSRARLIAQFR